MRHSANVVSVAQALHWLPHERFYAEVKRVLAPGGAFVAWGYHLPGIGVPPVDQAMQHFHDHVVGPYWRPERQYVVNRLRTLPFPFTGIDAPTTFEVHMPMSLATFGDFLRTQSATERYRDVVGEDPVPDLRGARRGRLGRPRHDSGRDLADFRQGGAAVAMLVPSSAASLAEVWPKLKFGPTYRGLHDCIPPLRPNQFRRAWEHVYEDLR